MTDVTRQWSVGVFVGMWHPERQPPVSNISGTWKRRHNKTNPLSKLPYIYIYIYIYIYANTEIQELLCIVSFNKVQKLWQQITALSIRKLPGCTIC